MTDEAARAQQLLDEGARILHVLWDEAVQMVGDPEHGGRHSPRATLAYARALLDNRASLPDLDPAARPTRADAAIRAVLVLQETRPDNAHYGNFRWALEEETVRDLNGVEFMLDALIPIAREHASRLPAPTIDAMRDAIALGLDEIERLDVHVSYTNIYLSDVCNSILGGELLDDEHYVERGAQRLDDWFAFTAASGAPHEYNSPTYLAVDLARMAALAEYAADPSIALRARVAEEVLWLHVAAHWHPSLLQLAGPHSRSYYDGWTGTGGYLKLMLWRVLGDAAIRRDSPYARHTREEGHVAIAVDPLHCPDYIVDLLATKAFPFASREVADSARGIDITTYMTENYALGTASTSYAVGDPPEPSLQPSAMLLNLRRDDVPGFGSLTSRYLINDKRAGAEIGDAIVDDLWDEGQVVSVQHQNRAIIAYGLLPRDRPIRSAKLSLRMLGVTDATEIWVGDDRVAAFPAQVQPGDAVVIAEGGVYIALIPLEPTDMGSDAPITINREGDLLTLDIYNYRGPSKVFWEYRTLGGAFYKGNVRNAVILEVADRTDFADTSAFRNHIAAARIADSVDPSNERAISYASDGGSVALRYSLLDMRLIEGKRNGASSSAPHVRAGAIDGSGPQISLTTDNIVGIGNMRLLAGTAPRHVIADAEARHYIVLKTTHDETPLLLETPNTMLDCDDIGFARIEIDENDATIAIEADGLLGTIRTSDAARLIINGTDVTDSMTAADGIREFHGLG